MKFALPQRWVSHGEFLLGLAIDNDQRYCLYVMNLSKVYIECLDKEAIVDRALSYGVARARGQLSTITSELCKALENDEAISVKRDNDTISVVVSEPIEWTFVAAQQPPESAALFFLALSILQARTIIDLQLRLALYERQIARKDRYVDFLQENVRALQMDDLLQRYKNTPVPFDAASFETNVRSAALEIDPIDDWLAVRKASLAWTGGSVDLSGLEQKNSQKTKLKLEIPSLPPDISTHSKEQLSSSFALHSQQSSQRKRRRLGGMSIGSRRSSSPIKTCAKATQEGDEIDAAGSSSRRSSQTSHDMLSSPVRTQRDSEE